VAGLAAIGATVAVLAVIHLRDLRGRYSTEAPPAPHDRTLLIVAASVCVALGPAFVSGITPAVPASAAALVLVGTCLVRNRPLLRAVEVPGSSCSDLLRVSAAGAGAANVVDNLPAYLALESVTDNDSSRLMALLIGVNAGPLITIWASLATILWWGRCRRAGVTSSVSRFAWQGAACAIAATIALALT
jgi:arsenical pump membrane protein